MAAVSNTPEYVTLLKCTSQLVDSIKQDVDSISNDLISEELVPSSVREALRLESLGASKKAAKIVDLVTELVKQTPDVYHVFMDVLSHQGRWISDCVIKVKKTFEENSAKVDADTTLPNNAEDPGFLCPRCQQCSLEEYCNDFSCCRFKDEPRTMEFPFLDTSKLSVEDRKSLDFSLTSDFVQIRHVFSDFRHELMKSFSISADHIKEIVAFLLTHEGLFSDEETGQLKKATSMADIFVAFSEHVSLFNFNLLERIIDKFGCEKDQENLCNFVVEFDEYCKRSVFEIPKNIFPSSLVNKKDRQCFAVKCSLNGVSVKKAREICFKFSVVLHIPIWALAVLSIEKGCVLLKLSIPIVTATKIFPLSLQQRNALRELHCTMDATILPQTSGCGTKAVEEVGFKEITIFEDEIGAGAYGSVHKAICDKLLCADATILPQTSGCGTEAVEEVGFKEITIFEDEIGAGAYGSVHKAICDKLLCADATILPQTSGCGTEAVEEVGFKEITIFEDEIGAGAYGSVHKAICDKLLCAAKRIYRILVQPSQATPSRNEHRIPIRRFEAEFKFLQEIRHPNIIQYLGMYTDPSTHLPILLMELMDENLTQYLEGSTQPIAYHVQVNICLDIMRALSFLHINEIVHRDLSSNNILLTGKPQHAKLSDFGMAKFLNTKMSRVSNTAVPGTEVYMPPEAFGDDFEESGDIFSFAVLLIQILTQKFPKPQGKLEDRIFDNKKIKALVKELERRNNHISLIPQDHPLLPIALHCLKDEEADRPLASDLCDRLASLTETALYTESKATEEKPQSITEDKCVGTTERKTEEKAVVTDSFDFEVLDYVVKEKLTRTEQALVESERAMNDQLKAKEKVLVNEIEKNDNLIEIQKELQEVLQQTENELLNISSAKTELEEKLKRENEQHQKTLTEQQKQIDSHCEKISEQYYQDTTHEELELSSESTSLTEKRLNQMVECIQQINERSIENTAAMMLQLETKNVVLHRLIQENDSLKEENEALLKCTNCRDTTQPATQASEVEQLSSRVAFIDLSQFEKIGERNIQVTSQLEKKVEQEEQMKLQNILSAKTELENKLRTLKQENEHHQQTLTDQQQQINSLSEKITEQNEQLATHMGKIYEQEQQQNAQSTTHLEKINEKEEQIKELHLQLEQQSSVNEKLMSELSSIKDSSKKQNSRQQNKAAPKENTSKTGADKESFFAKIFGSNKDKKVKLEEIPVAKVNDSTQQKLDASNKQPETTNEATLPKLDVDLPATSTEATLLKLDVERLKQTADMHQHSGITTDVMKKWNIVDDNDQKVKETAQPETSQAEQVRTKAAVNRIETSSKKAVATLTDAQRIAVSTNQALLHQDASIDKTERLQEQIQTDLKASVVPLSPVKTVPDIDTQPKLIPPKSRGFFSGLFGSTKEEIKEVLPIEKPLASKQSASSRNSKEKSKVKSTPRSNPFDESETFKEAKSEEMKFREQSAIQRMEESSARSVKCLVATKAMGAATVVELEQQSEQLDHIEKDHEKMRDGLTSGQDNIETIKSPIGWRSRKQSGKHQSHQSSQNPLPKSKPPSSKDKPQHTTTQLHQYRSTGSTVVDANLDSMSEMLSQLMDTGIAQGVLLDEHAHKLERIQVLADNNRAGFAAANRELKKQL